MPKLKVKIEVVNEDVLSYKTDVLALKYAQNFYGADSSVAIRMIEKGWTEKDLVCPPGGFKLLDTRDAIASPKAIFIGVKPLRIFEYLEIRKFGRKVLEALAGAAPNAKHIGLTLHGVGYGLDETEAFESEIAGLVDAITSGDIPIALEKIDIIELNRGRAERLNRHLPNLIPENFVEPDLQLYLNNLPNNGAEKFRAVGYASNSRSHVFVAMPFADHMDDVYHYAITNAVKELGMLCERADLSTFTGDIVSWIKERIGSSSLIIADLTGANPNVYLEVGYAWGKEIPTVLITQNIKDLHFDVKTHRCISYTKIKDLEENLTKELKTMFA